MRVAVGGLHFEDSFVQTNNEIVKGATAEIVKGNHA